MIKNFTLNSTITIAMVLSLSIPFISDAQIKFRNPVTPSAAKINTYKDDDSKTTSAKNYSCGTTKVYENHQGTDFGVSVGTQVYAAAKGGLYYRYDSCPTTGSMESTCGGRFGNHVRIDHESPFDDGSGTISVYAHMQKGSVAGLSSVLCSGKIGLSGSSGQSSGPHVHFEIRPSGFSGSSRRDPFAGSCSQTTSYWNTISISGMPGSTCQ